MTDQQPQTNGDSDEPEQPNVLVPQRGPDRNDMAASYLPEADDWLAKTALDLNDPHAVAALRQFHRMFPEVEDLDPIINEFSSDFMKGRTSINAQSREEYTGILKSMFGGGEEEDGFSAFAEALGAAEEDD